MDSDQTLRTTMDQRKYSIAVWAVTGGGVLKENCNRRAIVNANIRGRRRWYLLSAEFSRHNQSKTAHEESERGAPAEQTEKRVDLHARGEGSLTADKSTSSSQAHQQLAL